MRDGVPHDRIVIDPKIHHGEPCIRGTRISAAVIVGSLQDFTIDELLQQYPQLVREDINAAIAFVVKGSS